MKNEEVKEKKETTTKKRTTSGNQSTKRQKNSSTANKNTTKKEFEKKETTSKKTTKKKTELKNSVKEEKEKVMEEVIEEVIEEEFEEESEIEPTINKLKKKIKMSDIILILGLVIVVILGCLVMKGEKEELSYELPLALVGDNGLQQLSYQEYQDKIDNGESFVVIIERATCSHCVSFMPVAEEFARDHVPMYYVDTDTFSDEDWNEFEKSNTFFKKKSGNWGTPTTIVLAGKEAVDYIEGETTADKLEELYNQYFDMNKE